MATTTGPDLTDAQAAIEALMDDTCLITRDAGDSGDDAPIDQDTGVIADPSDRTVYDDRCTLSPPKGLVNRPSSEGGQVYTESTYSLSLPLSLMDESTEPLKGDTVTITSSRRDPSAVGKEFRITDVVYETFAVSRDCSLERRG